MSLGAEEVAREIVTEAAARHLPITIVRNGSRGMYWLEPLVEVGTLSGRVAYGPVAANDVAGLFDAGLLTGGAHTFARVGVIDPISLDA